MGWKEVPLSAVIQALTGLVVMLFDGAAMNEASMPSIGDCEAPSVVRVLNVERTAVVVTAVVEAVLAVLLTVVEVLAIAVIALHL